MQDIRGTLLYHHGISQGTCLGPTTGDNTEAPILLKGSVADSVSKLVSQLDPPQASAELDSGA